MDRRTRLLGAANPSSRILEIGPSHSPIAPKANGWNAHVVDHADRETLRTKYATAQVNLEAIEEVDTIWLDGPLADAIPTPLHGSFDVLIASHVIEHIPDFAGFLISAQRLLTSDGVVSLAVPDRRFCFDYFKPQTMTGDILEAHTNGRSRPGLRTVWNQIAYTVTMQGALGWGQVPVGPPSFFEPFANAHATYAAFSDDPASPYIDCHAWQFTPAGFGLVILELGQLGVIDWRVDNLHGPEGVEFYAFLRRGVDSFSSPAALQDRRLELLRTQMEEVRQQIDFALGCSTPPAKTLQNNSDVMCNLATIEALLHTQDTRLREIENAAHWFRAAMRPARAAKNLLGAPFRRSRPPIAN